LGAVSDTYDRTGDIRVQKSKIKNQKYKLNLKNIQDVLEHFIGKQKQMPPVYSAKKVGGRKAYELARKGEKVELREHDVEIYDIRILRYWDIKNDKSQYPNIPISQYLKLDVRCSSGTYIRSLAHDIGQKLSCGAYLQELERTAIGNFELDEAINLSKLTKENWQKFLFNFDRVMAAGTFEILHPGHQYFLRQAKGLGEKLTVIVARDKRAEQLRGRRLRFNENQRLQKIKTLDFVDEVLLGEEQDPYQSIKKIKPDIIALGYDQKNLVKNLPEKIKKFGLHTKIARIPAYFPDKYKSSLIQRTS
jgi:tRNA pseudouridine(55) synthase